LILNFDKVTAAILSILNFHQFAALSSSTYTLQKLLKRGL